LHCFELRGTGWKVDFRLQNPWGPSKVAREVLGVCRGKCARRARAEAAVLRELTEFAIASGSRAERIE
jgi:hypothetical protein